MMFMMRAANYESGRDPDSLGQRGEELFDATDDRFDAVADQVIADFAPQAEAYKELFTVAVDRLTAVVEWLESSGWTLYDPLHRHAVGPGLSDEGPGPGPQALSTESDERPATAGQSLPDKGRRTRVGQESERQRCRQAADLCGFSQSAGPARQRGTGLAAA